MILIIFPVHCIPHSPILLLRLLVWSACCFYISLCLPSVRSYMSSPPVLRILPLLPLLSALFRLLFPSTCHLVSIALRSVYVPHYSTLITPSSHIVPCGVFWGFGYCVIITSCDWCFSFGVLLRWCFGVYFGVILPLYSSIPSTSRWPCLAAWLGPPPISLLLHTIVRTIRAVSLRPMDPSSSYGLPSHSSLTHLSPYQLNCDIYSDTISNLTVVIPFLTP